MAKGKGCQFHAGIIDDDCKLTLAAKNKFIKEVKEELRYGTENLPIPRLFPCGDPVPPNPNADLLDLENEEKFPEFHKNMLGSFEKIACYMNMASDFKLLPIADPIALGAKLGVDISIPNFPKGFIPFMIPNPPLLALKMKVMPPPKLIKKFPTIPASPPPIPDFELPPKIEVPKFSTFFDFSFAYTVGIPKLLANLVAQLPKLVLKLPNLPGVFEAVCDIAFQSKIFGDIKPESTTEIVSVKALTTRVVEMAFISAVGTTIGAASGGIVGGIGRFLGYTPPDEEGGELPQNTRDLIMQYAEDCIGLSWGGDEFTQDQYAQRLLPVEYGGGEAYNGTTQDDRRAVGKDATIAKLKTASSCGIFVRACMYAAGASYVFDSKVDTSLQDPKVKLYYDFFKDQYPPGFALAGLADAARAKNAIIPYSGGDLPSLQKGDVIIVEVRNQRGREHCMLISDDYIPGTFSLSTIEGGQFDENSGEPTAIKRRTYVQGLTVPKGSNNYSMFIDNGVMNLAGRTVNTIIDGEILCTSEVGADMSKFGGPIRSLFRDGSGFGFQEEES